MDGQPPFHNRSEGALFTLWFDADSVIHGRADTLLAAELSLGGLDGYVAEQKLNLLQFTSGRVA
jgi:hypothetical protein